MKISISKVKIKATVMSIKIGIGKLRIGAGGSQSWDTTTNYVSALAVLTTSDTEQTITATIVGTDYDGVSFESSTDNITFTEHGTSANGTYSATGLIADTLYYWRSRLYKGSNYGGYSLVDSDTTFTAELGVYISGLTTDIGIYQKIRINAFIKEIKTGFGISSLDEANDIMYLFSGEVSESSLRNLIKRDFDATLAGAALPIFTRGKGFKGNGTTSYIKTNFIPSSDAIRYQKDNASFGVYANLNVNESKVIMGMRDAATSYSTYLFLRDSNQLYYIIQSLAGGNFANTDSTGMYILSRNASNQTSTYRNKIETTDTDNSVKLETEEFYILAYNAGGTPAFLTSNEVAFAYAGRKLSDAEVGVITDAYSNYITSLLAEPFLKTVGNWAFSALSQNSAQYYNGKTYIAYSGDSDDPYIITYTHATTTWSSPVKVGTNPLADGDWHGGPALLIDSSGYLHVMYGTHNTAVQYAKSTNPEDITAWTAMDSPAADAAYLRLFEISGVLYLFYRVSYFHRYRTSTDGGATWSAAVTISNNIAYIDFRQYGDKILCAGVGRDTTGYDLYNIYYFYLDGTQWKDGFGDNINLTVDPDVNATILVYNSGAAYTPTATPFIDADGNHFIYFLELTAGVGEPIGTYTYRILKFNGTSWDDYNIGTTTPRKSGDASAIEKVGDTMYVYLTNGGNSALMGGNLERWKSLDNGITWSKDKRIKAGNYIQPLIVKDGLQSAKLVFAEYDGVSTNFALWSYLWGEDGFV